MIPCHEPYDGFNMAYVARRLKLERNLLRERLHKLKFAYGLEGADRTIICLDDGLVYDAMSEDEIGDLNDQ